MAGKTPEPFGHLTDPFVVRLMKLLGEEAQATTALERLQSELAAVGSEPNDVLRREHHREAANQVTVGNCVLSLRLLSAIDWNSFFEQSSRVEAILREDPAGIYEHQDFQTSDRYRRVIETIARGSHADEIDVARHAIELAHRGRGSQTSPRDHVGFYLIDRGQADLKAAFSYQPQWRERLRDWIERHAAPVYFGAIAITLCALMSLVIAAIPGQSGTTSWLPLIAAAVLLLPLSELALAFVSQLVTLFLSPKVLPKLDFKQGVPTDHATFIVIPAMLTRPSSAPCCWNDWRPTTLPIPIRVSDSRYSRILPTPQRRRCRTTTDCSDDALERVRGPQQTILQRRRRTFSSCSIAAGSGTRPRAAGWAGNANAVSF